MQCGYCIPGMIMSALALLNDQAEPKRGDIIRTMNGNVCRCGTYQRIVTAIEQAAQVLRKGGGK
jgi:aerobic-type carbon monoxide dehydrogenase small subunit (CoxS/CutS family)